MTQSAEESARWWKANGKQSQSVVPTNRFSETIVAEKYSSRKLQFPRKGRAAGSSFSGWLAENFPKKSTRRRYEDCAKKFLQIISPEEGAESREGINQSFSRLVEGYSKGERDFESDLKEFIRGMQKGGLSPKTENLCAGVLKRFMEEGYGMKIEDGGWRRIRRRWMRKAKPVTRDKSPSREELRRILTHVGAKGRSLFLFLLSSGVRIGGALQLTIDDLFLDSDPPEAHIRGEYTKTGVGRVVYCSYEARDAIKEWLRVKGKLGKKTRKGGARTYGGRKIWPMERRNAGEMWRNALKKAGLDQKDPTTKIRIFHLHTLRKFFRSKLQADRDIVEVLMGHEGYLDGAYRRIPEEELATAYKNAMNSVTIFREESGGFRREANRVSLNTIIDVLKAQGVPSEEIAQAVVGSGYDMRLENGEKFEGFKNPLDDSVAKKIRQGLLILVKGSRQAHDCPQQKVVGLGSVEEYLSDGWLYVNSLGDGRAVVERRG